MYAKCFSHMQNCKFYICLQIEKKYKNTEGPVVIVVEQKAPMAYRSAEIER